MGKANHKMNLPNQDPKSVGSKYDFFVLWFAMFFPTVITHVYFNLMADSAASLQQSAYGIGKTLQFGLPVVWVWLFFRHRLSFKRSANQASDQVRTKPSLALGAGFGLLVAASMVVLFLFVIAESASGVRLSAMVREKIDSMGLASVGTYVAMGVFYTVFHSLMEEYYWRWFVYDLSKRFYSRAVANVISSIGFAAHHVIVLGFFFGWNSPWTYLISVSIAVGGAVWAWMYERDRTLWSAWVSHAIVDAGIFTLGYFIWAPAQ